MFHILRSALGLTALILFANPSTVPAGDLEDSVLAAVFASEEAAFADALHEEECESDGALHMLQTSAARLKQVAQHRSFPEQNEDGASTRAPAAAKAATRSPMDAAPLSFFQQGLETEPDTGDPFDHGPAVSAGLTRAMEQARPKVAEEGTASWLPAVLKRLLVRVPVSQVHHFSAALQMRSNVAILFLILLMVLLAITTFEVARMLHNGAWAWLWRLRVDGEEVAHDRKGASAIDTSLGVAAFCVDTKFSRPPGGAATRESALELTPRLSEDLRGLPGALSAGGPMRLAARVEAAVGGEPLVAPLSQRACVYFSAAAAQQDGVLPLPVAFAKASVDFEIMLLEEPRLRVQVRGEDVLLFEMKAGHVSQRGRLSDAPEHWKAFTREHRASLPGGEQHDAGQALDFQECALAVGAKITIVGELHRDTSGVLWMRPSRPELVNPSLEPSPTPQAPVANVLVSDNVQLARSSVVAKDDNTTKEANSGTGPTSGTLVQAGEPEMPQASHRGAFRAASALVVAAARRAWSSARPGASSGSAREALLPGVLP